VVGGFWLNKGNLSQFMAREALFLLPQGEKEGTQAFSEPIDATNASVAAQQAAFVAPAELLGCACGYTCAPLRTPLVPSDAACLTSFVSSFAPLVTPLHAKGLRLSIGYRQYRRSRREAERRRQSHQGKGLSTRDDFRRGDCTHGKPPWLG
jgi:hypothetical protein